MTSARRIRNNDAFERIGIEAQENLGDYPSPELQLVNWKFMSLQCIVHADIWDVLQDCLDTEQELYVSTLSKEFHTQLEQSRKSTLDIVYCFRDTHLFSSPWLELAGLLPWCQRVIRITTATPTRNRSVQVQKHAPVASLIHLILMMAIRRHSIAHPAQ